MKFTKSKVMKIIQKIVGKKTNNIKQPSIVDLNL